MKWCNKCKQWKGESEFSKKKASKDGLQSNCRKCKNEKHKEWYENNREYRLKKDKEWYENNKEHWLEKSKERYEDNKEHILERQKERYEDNKEHILERQKEWRNSPLNYNSKIRKEVEKYEQIRESINSNVEAICKQCEEWFEPTKIQIYNRLKAINERLGGDNNLYCSNECKQSCSIFNKHYYPEGQTPPRNREVQPELRDIVLKRDNHTCIKCQRHQNEIEVHCHHMEGIRWNPIESADEDICITLCKDCHDEVHDQDGCRYHELRCSY